MLQYYPSRNCVWKSLFVGFTFIGKLSILKRPEALEPTAFLIQIPPHGRNSTALQLEMKQKPLQSKYLMSKSIETSCHSYPLKWLNEYRILRPLFLPLAQHKYSLRKGSNLCFLAKITEILSREF